MFYPFTVWGTVLLTRADWEWENGIEAVARALQDGLARLNCRRPAVNGELNHATSTA